jgi:glycosyltransferase involved in cell wall biosynthesis
VLYDRDDDQAAVDAVVDLLRDPARRQILAKAARAQAERFGAGAVVPRYEALYRLVLAQRSIPEARCAP